MIDDQIHCLLAHLERLQVENERLKDQVHYYKGTCDLLAEQGKEAEAEIERLQGEYETAQVEIVERDKIAADEIERLRVARRALWHIRAADTLGFTADEVAKVMSESVLTIRPRVAELVKMQLIRDSGQRRKNKSGKRAIVWVRA